MPFYQMAKANVSLLEKMKVTYHDSFRCENDWSFGLKITKADR